MGKGAALCFYGIQQREGCVCAVGCGMAGGDDDGKESVVLLLRCSFLFSGLGRAERQKAPSWGGGGVLLSSFCIKRCGARFLAIKRGKGGLRPLVRPRPPPAPPPPPPPPAQQPRPPPPWAGLELRRRLLRLLQTKKRGFAGRGAWAAGGREEGGREERAASR